MTPERYRRVVEIFEQACHCNLEHRGEFLNQACNGENDLRVEVEAMLTADEQAGRFLHTMPGDIAAAVVASKQSRSLIGQDLGDYQVIAHLGTGGMGEVFLAQDTRLGRRAALKFLHEEYDADPVRLRRFKQEACAVSALNHPNIVTVYGLGRAGRINFIATEFVEGRTLRDELANGPFAPETVVEIALQAVSALAAAHGAGIIHRDIKPENIMVRADGFVKILDFGLAKRAESRVESSALTSQQEFNSAPGFVVGTPRYMSPEQARGLAVDARTDLFSLACVLYEMLSGSPAVGGTNTNPCDILAALLTRDPDPLETLRPQCPGALVRIVARALKKDREARYHSAEEMLSDLKSVRQEIQNGSARPVARHLRYPLGSRRWLIAGSASTASLLLMIAGWTWFAQRDTIGEVTSVSPLTTYPGDESQPSLSPDGRQVAFSWGSEKDDNRDIYVLLLGAQHPRRLTIDPAEDAYPAWSPDGNHIAFIRRHEGTKAEIILIAAIGGPERILRKIRLGTWMTGRMLAWSPDGKWLCFTNEVGTSGHHVLFLLSPDSGAVRQLLPEDDNGLGDSSPAFSPDGHWLAFCRFLFPSSSKLFLQRLSPDLNPQAAPLPVKDAGVNPKAPIWTQNGKIVLFLEGARIMQVKVGSAARPFYISPFGFSELTVAGSGPRLQLVASLQNKTDQIWTLTLGARGLTATGHPERIVQSTHSESQPQFSPDGRQLAFKSNRTGASEIWLGDADGRNARQLTHLSAYVVGYPHWSPDGQFLVFHARFPSEPHLYIARASDGVVRQVTYSKPGFATPSWSTDGQTLYANARTKGETYVYSVPVAGGVPKLLWKGADAVEAPGRKLLLYDKEDESGIYARALTGDPANNPEHLLVADYQAPWGGFYPFENGIYYVGYTSGGRPRAFRFYLFDTAKSVDVAPAPDNLGSGLTVTPDRTHLAFSTNSRDREDLVQIELR